MSQATICGAIKTQRIITFYYFGDKTPGMRTVEPHMVAYNSKGHLALSAWFLGGASASRDGSGWREYLLSDISGITASNQTFAGARDGYQRSGGTKFHNVQCAL